MNEIKFGLEMAMAMALLDTAKLPNLINNKFINSIVKQCSLSAARNHLCALHESEVDIVNYNDCYLLAVSENNVNISDTLIEAIAEFVSRYSNWFYNPDISQKLSLLSVDEDIINKEAGFTIHHSRPRHSKILYHDGVCVFNLKDIRLKFIFDFKRRKFVIGYFATNRDSLLRYSFFDVTGLVESRLENDRNRFSCGEPRGF